MTKTTRVNDPRFDGYSAKICPEPTQFKSAAPAPDEMAMINRLALKELGPADVAVYDLKVCSNQVDRDGERFSNEVLEDFVVTLPGKGLLLGHEWGRPGVGRFFGASLQEQDGVMWLMGKCYLLRADADAKNWIVKIDGGTASWVSVGFFAPAREVVIGPDQEPMFVEYRRGANGERAEAIEASLVFLGAQYDAAIAKGAAALAEKHAREVRRAQASMRSPEVRSGLLGKMAELFERWFGAADPELPFDALTKTLEAGSGNLGDAITRRVIDQTTKVIGTKDGQVLSRSNYGHLTTAAAEIGAVITAHEAAVESRGKDEPLAAVKMPGCPNGTECPLKAADADAALGCPEGSLCPMNSTSPIGEKSPDEFSDAELAQIQAALDPPTKEMDPNLVFDSELNGYVDLRSGQLVNEKGEPVEAVKVAAEGPQYDHESKQWFDPATGDVVAAPQTTE